MSESIDTPRPRYLTKSRFKLGCECPTKLFYTAKKDIYPDKSLEDYFLAALAEGGFQVGELAKCMFPGGNDIEDLDYETSLAKTAALLKEENVTIFEAAFLFGNLFVRVDVLDKKGKDVRLFEVKSKSCDGNNEEQFLGKRAPIKRKWRSYLEDIGFQAYVVGSSFPEWNVHPYLMLVDKNSVCPTDGLHQKFLIRRDSKGRAKVDVTGPLLAEEIANDLIVQVSVKNSLKIIMGNLDFGPDGDVKFEDWIHYLEGRYTEDKRIWTAPGAVCSKCQFQADSEELSAGKKSGFRECWKRGLDFSDTDFDQPTVLDIWDFRKKDKFLAKGLGRCTQIDESEFEFKSDPAGAIIPQERQWIQIDKGQRQDVSHELRNGLKKEMSGWRFPLHFIDFETMTPAIPMHAGCSPYDVLAFQFSHHVMEDDGSLRHAGEYIEERRGVFPNVAFVRALKEELEGDEGTIFRYSHHENTVLCGIRRQLIRKQDVHQDADELIAFIESISQPPENESGAWGVGPRNMVDLLEMVKKYYYDPIMKGSNSIKQVLPAVLRTSPYLRERYGSPIYGVPGGIHSNNFKEMVWFQEKDGEVVDPYKLLPTMFDGFSEKDRELLLSIDGSIDNGGAAMTAFARMQFSEMGDAERAHLRELLLKYCELDTLAMVMIYEAWREWFQE